MTLEYRVGDIFADAERHDIGVVIAHVVNNVGAFGAGFAAAVAKRYPHVRTHYYANFSWYNLGQILLRDAISDARVVVANLFAQDGLPSKDNPQPLRYMKLRDALFELRELLADIDEPYEVWMPRIGTGYGGGDWNLISEIIDDTLVRTGLKVVVYDLP